MRMIFAAAGIALCAAGISGCMVGPDYDPPAPPPGASAQLASANAVTESAAEPPDAWWQLYDDSRLNDYVREALKANADLAVAEANISAAKAVLQATRAGLYPTPNVTAGGIYGRDASTDEILEIDGHKPRTTWVVDDILAMSYELDLFGRVRRSIEEAHANTEAAAAARDSARVAVVAETARAYAHICALGEEVAVARQSADVTAHEANITSDRLEAGAGSRFDVARAKALAAQTKAAIPGLAGQQRVALFELTAVLGRTPQFAPVETLSCREPPHLKSVIPVGDGAGLLRRRPDVREAERKLAAATAEIGVATADLFPRVSLTGLYGGIGANLTSLGNESGLTWGVGPSISWAFPNQEGPRARIRQAKAEARAALANFDSVVLHALEETEQSLVRYNSDLDQRRELAIAQSETHEAYRLAHDAFLNGSISTLDLLTSEQAFVTSDAAVASVDAAIAQDQIAVFQALGGGWRTPAKGAQ